MKNKKLIYMLVLCITVIFLYACSDKNDEIPPEDEVITDATDVTDAAEEEGTIENNTENNGGEETETETETEEIEAESETENSEFENMSYSEEVETETESESETQTETETEITEPESDPVSPPFSGDITKIGYFTVQTLPEEAPVLNDDATMTLPGGGTIIADNGSQFTVESGAVLYCDEMNSPFKLSIHESLRIASKDNDIIIESPNGVTISIDGMAEETVEQEKFGDGSPWWIYFNESKHAVFEFIANGVKCTSLDSVFPLYKDVDNGTVLFKKCTIELTDGTIIDAPLNTIAKIADGVFTITIGMGEAKIIKPDGTVSSLPKGTVIDSNF